MRARSSAEPPNSISTAASWIISPAPKPTICTPSTRSVAASARIFDEAVGVAHRAGAAVGGERELADLVGDARGLQLFLGFADAGDFRAGVDDAGDDVVVHVARLAGEDFGERDAFVLGLVGEHRPAHDVADRVDAGRRWSRNARR